MLKNEIQKTERVSENIGNESLQKLRRVFPQFVKDSEVDFDALQKFFEKEGIMADAEKYGLSWAGKSEAFKAIRAPSTGTLTPQLKESKNWDKTQNLFIEGDNLEALKLLQKHYRGQIKMIYIDPPYNTGKDFIYKDNFTESTSDYYERTGQSKGGIKMTTNPESSGRYHSDWLTMMYPRLFLARNLLRDDGVMFISIDDNEVHNLRMIMDEIFGEENFVECIIWKKKYGGGAKEKYLVSVHEYILVYAKTKVDLPEILVEFEEEKARRFYKYKDAKFETLGYYRTHPLEAVKSFDVRENLRFSVVAPDSTAVYPKRQWRWSKERFHEALSKDEVIFNKNKDGEWVLYSKQYLNEENGEQRKTKAQSVIDDVFTQEGTKETVNAFGDAQIFSFPKPIKLIQKLFEIGGLKSNDIMLDFFAGSGTTAHAVMAQNTEDGGNRKWICVQLPEEVSEDSEAKKAGFNTIAEIARERIRRAAAVIARSGATKQFQSNKKDEIAALPLVARNDELDLGFKSFVLEKSNYRQWNVLTDQDDKKKLKEQMKLFTEKPLVDKYDESSIIYEILLKEGFDLNTHVSQSVIPVKAGIQCWVAMDGDPSTSSVQARRMVITFAKKITKEQVEKLGLSENDIFVCFDSALDDTTKVNIMRNLIVKVI